MNIPLISVIVPVYNAEKYLPKCLDSILAQTYKKLEIILVDDGSTDNSGKICDEYALKDSRIKIIHKQNGGVSSARNVALSVAKGEYIGFVDSDDYIENDMYEYLFGLCEKYKTKISVCNFIRIIKGKFYNIDSVSKESALPYYNALTLLHAQLFVCNKLFAAYLFKDYKFNTNITFGEDMIVCTDIFDKTDKVAYGPLGKYYYVENNTSATKKTFYIKKLTYFKAAEYVLEYAKRNSLNTLIYEIKEQICYHAVGFLRQIAAADYCDKKVISDLQKKVRKGIFKHLLSKHKISNKLFALVCCVSWPLAQKIYLLLYGEK